MQPFAVIEDVDVLEDGLARFVTSDKTLLGVDQLFFKRSPKAFHTGVIEASPFSSEARQHLLNCKLTLIGVRGVLGEFNRSLQHVSEVMIAER